MVQLILVYCMMSDTSCVENRPMSEYPLSPMGCMVSAEPVASTFLREHPRYHLASWRCEIDKPLEKQA